MTEKQSLAQIAATDVPVAADSQADELYIDGFAGIALGNGVIKLNLYVDRYSLKENKLERHVVKRLTMPISVLVSFRQGLEQLIDRLVQDGTLPAETLKDTGSDTR